MRGSAATSGAITGASRAFACPMSSVAWGARYRRSCAGMSRRSIAWFTWAARARAVSSMSPGAPMAWYAWRRLAASAIVTFPRTTDSVTMGTSSASTFMALARRAGIDPCMPPSGRRAGRTAVRAARGPCARGLEPADEALCIGRRLAGAACDERRLEPPHAQLPGEAVLPVTAGHAGREALVVEAGEEGVATERVHVRPVRATTTPAPNLPPGSACPQQPQSSSSPPRTATRGTIRVVAHVTTASTGASTRTVPAGRMPGSFSHRGGTQRTSPRAFRARCVRSTSARSSRWTARRRWRSAST